MTTGRLHRGTQPLLGLTEQPALTEPLTRCESPHLQLPVEALIPRLNSLQFVVAWRSL